MNTYNCPVCKKSLSKTEYERALGILGEREKHLEHEKYELQRKLREAQTKEKKARQDGINVERARTQRLLAGKEQQIRTLQERISQLKKGTTPQTDGLEFEETLTARLKREFPEDEIQHKGKGGDILQIVRFEKTVAGSIIYECKRTPRIPSDHVEQACEAKQACRADFAVLVTTGQKKGFCGLSQMGAVLVVSPLGTIPLASLLRGHLIEMLRAQITKDKRAIVAQRLMKYITGAQFRNPIEEVVQLSTELKNMIREEALQHYRVWQKRDNFYQRIRWDSSQIQNNLQLVLHGMEPKTITQAKISPLQLPSPN
jgi:hypothetical protein